MRQDKIVGHIERIGRCHADALCFLYADLFDVFNETHRTTAAVFTVNGVLAFEPKRFKPARQTYVHHKSIVAVRNFSAMSEAGFASFGFAPAPVGDASKRTHQEEHVIP